MLLMIVGLSLVLAVASNTSNASIETSTPKVQLNEYEQGIIDGTNATRARYGLPPLDVYPGLEDSARGHAAWMTNNRSMQHSGANCGENIACGQHSVDEAMQTWVNSPGHLANILGPYRWIGASAYTAPDGTVYWCEQFVQ